MSLEIDTLWRKLYPLVIDAIGKKLEGAASGGGSLSHALNGPLHTGTLDDAQAPQFLKTDGTRTLLGNLAVGAGITLDGVDLSAFKLLYDAHILNADAHHAGFVALKDTAGTVVAPDGADRITISGSGGVSSVGGTNVIALALNLQTNSGLTINGAGQVAVGQGAGLTVGASTVALTTPGAVSVSSTNTAAGNHTHAVTSSSSPGQAAALLATTAAGKLTLYDLGMGRAIDWSGDTFLTRAAAGRLRISGNVAGTNPASLNVLGALAVGVDGTPAAQLVSQASGEQLRLAYTAATAAKFTVNAGGTLSLAAPGEVIVDLGGRAIKPIRPYETNLGSLANKWLSVYAAELWVDTIVANETMATVGGRILVSPTTTLTAPASSADSAITVKHNNSQVGDTLYAEGGGAVEFVQVTALVSNPLRNASFEDKLDTYWTSYNSPTLTQVNTAEAVAGADLLRIAAGGTAGGVRQEITGLTVGATYTLSVRARALAGTVADVIVRLSDGGGSSGSVATTTTVEPTWQLLSVSKVVPASGNLRAWIEVAAGATAEVDAALLNSGATADPVFYANTADANAGGYRLTVTRDLDGSGANNWTSGTAFVNTGQAGSGFMDLYSIAGITAIPFSYIFSMKTNGATPWETGTFGLNRAIDPAWEWFENGTAAIGDCVYIGNANATFSAFAVSLAVGYASTGTIVTEYWNGTAWTAFTPTAVYGALTAAGRFGYTLPTMTGWAAKTINGVSAYWIRYRYSVAGTLTTRARTNVRAARQRTTYGPSIVGNVRQSTTYNDWAPHWAIGNLNGLYDYASDVFGAALGKYSTATAWLGADATNGLRMMRGTTPRLTLDSNGTIRQGENVSAAATTRYLLVGAAGNYGEANEALGVGDLMLGRNGASQANMLYDQSEGRLKFRGGTTTQAYVDTDGSIVAGGGLLTINASGIVSGVSTSYANVSSYRFAATNWTRGGLYAGENFSGTTAKYLAVLNQVAGATSAITEIRATGSATSPTVALSLIVENPTLSSALNIGLAGGGFVSGSGETFTFGTVSAPVHVFGYGRLETADRISTQGSLYVGNGVLNGHTGRAVAVHGGSSDISMGTGGFSQVGWLGANMQLTSIAQSPLSNLSWAFTRDAGSFSTSATGLVLNGNGSGGLYVLVTGPSSGAAAVPASNNFFNPLSATSAGVAAPIALGVRATPTTGVALVVNGLNTSSGSFAFAARDSTSANLIYVRNDGYLWANRAWDTTSDARRKRDIADIADPLGLLLQVRPRTFRMVDDPTDRLQYGVVAQELPPEIAADFITLATPPPGEDGAPVEPLYGLSYQQFIGLLIGAVQHLHRRVVALEGA